MVAPLLPRERREPAPADKPGLSLFSLRQVQRQKTFDNRGLTEVGRLTIGSLFLKTEPLACRIVNGGVRPFEYVFPTQVALHFHCVIVMSLSHVASIANSCQNSCDSPLHAGARAAS